jgi:N-acetylglucosamine-6-sulfatase
VRSALGGRRSSRALGATVVLVALLAIGSSAAAGRGSRATGGTLPAAGKRPLNVVFIVSDDERIDGNTVMRNVRGLLAAHGVTFTNFDVTTSECGPSRATILTGQYSHHTGVTANFGSNGYPAFNDRSDLATWLQGAGYETALVGKYINDYSLDGHNEIPPGWNRWIAMDSVPLEKYYNYDLNVDGKVVHYGDLPNDYSTTVLTTHALDFLRATRRPFFLYFAPVTPHLPAIPAPQDIGKLADLAPLDSPAVNQKTIASEPWAAWHARSLTAAGRAYILNVRRNQLESLLSLDRSVKEIVDTLARRHLLDRTVIFYTSDNGFLWGEHRLGGKLWPYGESTHVPLIVRTPWTNANGTVNAKPVLNIDFASTISALAGIRPGLPQDGSSFVPMLHGKTVSWRKSYLIEYLGGNQLKHGGPPPYVAIRTPRYLYVKYRYRGWQELYDLRRDPYELRNVAADPADAKTVASLRRTLQRQYDAPARSAPD